MPDYDLHRPTFTGTTTNDWEFPTEQDFETDDLSRVAEHFLLSASGFDDPGRFDDLQLPVVNGQGYLSLNGLWAARRGPYSVERIDVDPETRAAVRDLIDDLGRENFAAYRDVTVTAAEWDATTGGESTTDTGIVSERIDSAKPSYTPGGAVIGLAFLACGSAALAWTDE